MACVCTLCPADRLSQHGPSPQPLAPGSNRQQCECAVLRGYWCWSVLLGLRWHVGLFQGSRNDAKGAALLGAPGTTITSISTAQPRVPTMQARFALTNAPCTHQTPWQSLIQRSFHCVLWGCLFSSTGVQHPPGGCVGEGSLVSAAPLGGCSMPALCLQQPADGQGGQSRGWLLHPAAVS